jgi:hypothetical protein
MNVTKESLISLFPQEFLIWMSRDTKKYDSRCTFPIEEISPFSEGIIEDFVNIDDDILLKYDNEKNILHFGSNIYGSTVCISLGDKNYGFIFYYDNEERCLWSDEQFSFIKTKPKNLQKYLEMRSKEQSQSKSLALSSYYLVASNFNEFQSKCVSYNLDESSESTLSQKNLYDALEVFDESFLKKEILANPNWKDKFNYKSRATLTQLCASLGYLDTFVFLVQNKLSAEKCLKAARNNGHKNIEAYIISNDLPE